MRPGLTQFTVTPVPPYCTAADFVMAITAAFEAE
jgi:hypothetical protein